MANSGWTRTESPFHAGELTIQARLGRHCQVKFLAEKATTIRTQFLSTQALLSLSLLPQDPRSPAKSRSVGEASGDKLRHAEGDGGDKSAGGSDPRPREISGHDQLI